MRVKRGKFFWSYGKTADALFEFKCGNLAVLFADKINFLLAIAPPKIHIAWLCFVLFTLQSISNHRMFKQRAAVGAKREWIEMANDGIAHATVEEIYFHFA